MVLTSIFLALQLRLDLAALIRARSHPLPAPAQVTCGIRVVGFHFEGVAGQRFELSGKSWTIGREGFSELLSDGETTYEFEGRTLPLDAGPLDSVSMRVIQLPKPGTGGRK